ncbi:glycoside hydrolase 5 family protein [Flavobacterium sp. 3HN19-14]|uniref:glycoside hydrolase 5 family protein n=1 Tax=Flavobacterium sp. 3HN19-14 TaxID=3448133 RepID=UPI003EE1B665
MRRIFVLLLLVCGFVAFAQTKKTSAFITVKGTQFYKNGKPYSYIGANYWYGAILGSEKYGDRKRLLRELDQMKANGIDNLRILVGADGGGYDYTVPYAVQPEQGKYDADLLKGLDFLLSEMGKRSMYAVLYLTNNWEWSGGMSQYLEWNGYGKIPNPNISPENTWDEFMAFVPKFHSCEPCKTALREHIKFIICRTNSFTKKPYIDDAAIMAWQVSNEPRIFTVENEKAFAQWLNETVDLIDSLDKNHLICTGSEGSAGSNADLLVFEKTHTNPKIDYLTMHIWPKNWNWYKADDAENTLPAAIEKASKYMEDHIAIAKRINKPIVVEEFGLPRENESLLPGSSVVNRDRFYQIFFERLVKSHDNKEALAGVNFWGFGGEGKAVNDKGKWNKGDAFTADPPQEPQGLNTVFSSDKTTLEMVKRYNHLLK